MLSHEQDFICGDEICKKIAAFLFTGNQLIHILHVRVGTLYNLFVAVHATWFNTKHILVLPHTHTHTHNTCMCFMWFSDETGILASITDGECVYFAVRTDYILTQVDSRLTNVVLTRKTSGRRLWPL